jgi:hypothetical protein
MRGILRMGGKRQGLFPLTGVPVPHPCDSGCPIHARYLAHGWDTTRPSPLTGVPVPHPCDSFLVAWVGYDEAVSPHRSSGAPSMRQLLVAWVGTRMLDHPPTVNSSRRVPEQPPLLHSPAIYPKIHRAHRHSRACHYPSGQIGIHDRIEVVQHEAALVRIPPCPSFKILLRQCERTRPWSDLHQNPPHQRSDVKHAPYWPPARPQRSKDYKQQPRQMDRQYEACGSSH